MKLVSAWCAAILLLASGQPTATAQEAPTGTDARQQRKDPLVAKVEEAVDVSRRRYLTGNVHTPWQIIHGVLAYHQDFQIKVGDEKVSAVEWMSAGQSFDGQPWFQKTQYGGRAHPFTRAYAFEGHPNQFLAVLSIAELPPTQQFQTPDGPITIAQMVEHAKAEVNSREEVTWTLWALSHYLPPDATWTNRYGEAWSIEKMVSLQARADLAKAACGGTHGMFALSYARNQYIKTGKPLYGVWFEADQRIRQHIEIARSLQNADGTFSNSFFQGRSQASDFNDRLASSGHTLEFLMMGLPANRLNEPWVRRALEATADDLIVHRRESAKVGPLYHALSGLQIYLKRIEANQGLAQQSAPPPVVPNAGGSNLGTIVVPEPAQ